MLSGPYFAPILQVTLCSQTCLVRCYFFNLLKFVIQQINEQKRTEKETQPLKIIKKKLYL